MSDSGFQNRTAAELSVIEHYCSGCHHRWEGDPKGAELCGDCWRKARGVVQGNEQVAGRICRICYKPFDQCSHCAPRSRRADPPQETQNRGHCLRTTFTNDVIRAIGALARQQNVCREQDGQVVFVTGMEAAREYIVEHVAKALLTHPTAKEP